jgi:hypothetical protein
LIGSFRGEVLLVTIVATRQPRAQRWSVAACLLAIVLSCAACSTAHYPINPPLTDSATGSGYTIRNLDASGNSDSLTVIRALSGGGYRAAALSFAVIELMRDTPIRWMGHDRTLLQELDFISAVSGGSLTAAFYAQDPDRFYRSQVERRTARTSTWSMAACRTTRVFAPHWKTSHFAQRG